MLVCVSISHMLIVCQNLSVSILELRHVLGIVILEFSEARLECSCNLLHLCFVLLSEFLLHSFQILRLDLVKWLDLHIYDEVIFIFNFNSV